MWDKKRGRNIRPDGTEGGFSPVGSVIITMRRRPHAPEVCRTSLGVPAEKAGQSYGHDRDVYLAHLVVLSGQLVSRFICSYGVLILVLLIISSVDPLLRMSDAIKDKAPEYNTHCHVMRPFQRKVEQQGNILNNCHCSFR